MLMHELSPVYYHLVLRGQNHGVLANRSFSFNYDLDRANLAINHPTDVMDYVSMITISYMNVPFMRIKYDFILTTAFPFFLFLNGHEIPDSDSNVKICKGVLNLIVVGIFQTLSPITWEFLNNVIHPVGKSKCFQQSMHCTFRIFLITLFLTVFKIF